MSREQVRNWWDNVQSSLWYIPAMFGFVALALSFIMPEIDSRVEDELTRHQDWLFFGTSDSARSILSAISSSLITVIALLFSITILTLQQASTQFTPRIIRTFMRDRGIQIVLGVFLATFLYALLVLRQVRGEDAVGGSSVPMLSVSLAVMLTIACLGLLIYFIHHTATMFQAATIIERIHHDTLEAINLLYPEAFGEPADGDVSLAAFRERHTRQPSRLIRADSAGFLRRVDDGAIVAALGDGSWAIVHPRIGTYVTQRQELLEVGGAIENSEEQIEQLRGTFVFDKERTLLQDDLFGIRQLADIGLKALSPAVNDPTTAEHALSCMADILAVVADRAFPAASRTVTDDEGTTRVTVWVNRPSFADYVNLAFGQIRRTARDDVHATEYLLGLLVELASHATDERQLAVQH
ncbi:MAG: DUF2254 domain-containing protein, partial [Chloroflexota bacterium]|nr:DUF2254 domain-containing protein [Chloroflexota bacterium]